MLDVELLGPARVTLDGEPIEVDTRKAIAILAYLTIEGQATRDTLAGLFWADSPQERARATLRRTLSALRSATGSVIDADRSLVTLIGDFDSDVDRLERELAATSGHDHDPRDVCSLCIPSLRRATALFRGEFLQGFAVQGSPEFDDWVRSVAEATRLKIGETFNRLGTALAADGEYRGAIDAVNHWIDLDPLHEPAHRFLMLLHAWAGDRPGAMEAYRRCTAVLDHELGVPPLEETTELYEAILEEDLPPAPGMRRRVRAAFAPPTSRRAELIDREEETALLSAALERASSHGGTVALVGAAWMGKTRLLDELAETAKTGGITTLVGRAFRMEQGLPFGVAAQLMRPLTPLVEAEGERLPLWAVTEVSRLIPELARGLPPHELTDPFGELRLFDGVFTLLETIPGPLLVMVDDAQWLDPASAGLLSYLARRIEQLPALLVITVRSGEPLPGTVDDLVAESSSKITLGPLTVDQLLETAGSPAAAADLHLRTGGIPLLVTDELAGAVSGTSGMTRYMEARLRDLSDLGRQVVAAAAVLDGSCDVVLLRETSGRTEEEVVDAVEELVGAGLLLEMPEGNGLRFALEALERLAYESTSLTRRRLLHRRAASAMAGRPGSNTDPRLAAAVATQHEGAGSDTAAEWYRLAGDLSRRVYAHTEAREMYLKSLGLGHRDPAPIHISLGEVAMAVGNYDEALVELNTAAALADRSVLAVAEHRLGEVHRLTGRFELAEAHFSRSSRSDPSSAELYADWALLHHRLGDEESAIALAAEAARRAEADRSDALLSRVHNIIGVVSIDQQTAGEHFDLALDLAGNDELLRLAGLNNKAHLLAETGDLEGAVGLVGQAIELAAQTGNRHREAALHDHLADLHHRAGREEEAQSELTRAVTLFSGIETTDWQPEIWLLSRW